SLEPRVCVAASSPVAAWPVTALNTLDVRVQESGVRSQWSGFKRKRLSLLLIVQSPRLLVALAAVLLGALTWPGWLQGFHRRDRFLGWAVRPDPSLRRVAETLARWREQGAMPPEVRSFALHPDVSHYCAWFAPAEKGFI